MVRAILNHPEVPGDVRALGRVEARRIVAAIDQRFRLGELAKSGMTLRPDLAGCRRLRIGQIRIVYRLEAQASQVLVIGVGPRRADEFYLRAKKRS